MIVFTNRINKLESRNYFMGRIYNKDNSTDQDNTLKNDNDNNYQIQTMQSLLKQYDIALPNEKKLKVLDVQEKERQRIARDLHDSSLQNLTHLVHRLELTSKYMDDDIIQAKLELMSVKKNLKEVIDEIRNTIFDLRPMSFDDLGLQESIERLVYQLDQMTDMKIELSIQIIQCSNSLILMTIYRIIQEALTNAVKHSKGSKVLLSAEQTKEQIEISVKDDGQGFDYNINSDEKHFGLRIMEERISLLSGSIHISSNQNGTEIIIKIPYKEKEI